MVNPHLSLLLFLKITVMLTFLVEEEITNQGGTELIFNKGGWKKASFLISG